MDVNVLKVSIESIGSQQEIKNKQEKIKNNFKSQPNNLPNQSNRLFEDCISSISSPAADDNQQLKIAILSQRIVELSIKFDQICNTVSKVELAVDDLEQYGRRNCLILHGLYPKNLPNPYSNYDGFVDELTRILNSYQNLGINRNQIDTAHPLPTAKNGKIPIILKFIRRSDRNMVFRNKKALVKSGLALTESLTKRRLILFVRLKASWERKMCGRKMERSKGATRRELKGLKPPPP